MDVLFDHRNLNFGATDISIFGILGTKTSLDMCFAVCSPLQSFLELAGYDTELIMGYVGIGNHYWLRQADGTIIDPTADQFNYRLKDKMPPVYIGKKPDWMWKANQTICEKG